MNPVEFRALSITEQRALRQQAQGNALVVHAWMAFCLFFIVTSIGSLSIQCVAGPPGKVQTGVLASIAGALALALLWGLEHWARPARARLAADLADARAITETFDAVDAIQVEEDSEVERPPSYYLKLADGRVLFLSGQYLQDHEERFPSTRFAITRLPRSRIFLSLESLGERLQPSSKLHAFPREGPGVRDEVPDDGEILQVGFESLRPG